jgi:hypothetical protein
VPIMTEGVFDKIRSADRYEPLGSYRIPCRNEIAQKDERGVNPLQGETLIAKANPGSITCCSIGQVVEIRVCSVGR